MLIKVATFVLFGFALTLAEENPKSKPRILVVGPTMVGKSLLANAFLGNIPNKNGSSFKVCHGFETCTKQVTVLEGTAGALLNTELVVIDTPGFGEDADMDALASMAKTLKDKVKSVDMIVAVFEGRTGKIDHKALVDMEAFFGKVRFTMAPKIVAFFNHAPLHILQEMWSSTIIAVNAVPEESEQHWSQKMNQNLQKKFDIKKELPVYYLDARALKNNDLKQKTIFQM